MLASLRKGPFFLIAGPCVIESADVCLAVASHLKNLCAGLGIGYVFKASFDKANRSSSSSFRGPGLEDGMVVLRRIKHELDIPLLTDVHETSQVIEAAETVDILQVPAFLARQTDLLQACARTGKAVNIKKGQFMAPQEMAHALEKVKAAQPPAPIAPIYLTERGTFFGYNRLVNDFSGLAVMKEMGAAVIFDVTHSTQHPAGLGASSGGNPHYTPLLARAAVAAGVDGLFLECHPDPSHAKSDAATMMSLDAVAPMLQTCVRIAEALR